MDMHMYDLSLGGTSIMCIKPFIIELVLEFSWGWRFVWRSRGAASRARRTSGCFSAKNASQRFRSLLVRSQLFEAVSSSSSMFRRYRISFVRILNFVYTAHHITRTHHPRTLTRS